MINTPERKRSQGRANSGPASPRPRPVRHVNLDLFTLKDIPDIDLDIILECLNKNEYGDAQLFAELFTGRCIFDHTDQLWYIWEGHYWKQDSTQRVKHFVSGVLASTYLKAVAEVNLKIARLEAQGQADDEEIIAQIKRYKGIVKELHGRVHSLRFMARMKNILAYAQAYLSVEAHQWDTDRWVLGTQGGVIDLHTGKLRPGKPEDYIRTVIPTKWRGLNEPSPRFDRFLQEIFEDRSAQERADIINFLSRMLGYGITGLTREHHILMLFGEEGRNGKDTLMARLQKVMGSIATPAPKDIMIASARMASPGACKPHLAFLQGKRIAFASETDKGERFSVAQMKELSGGGDITARNPHGREFTFSPSHLLVLLTNNKPHADASDTAFWQRLCPVIFNMHFIEEPDPSKPYDRKADTALCDALDKEASGILAWLVRGCLEWQRIGMKVPACVQAERANYRKEEDTLGHFLQTMCVTGKTRAGGDTEVKPQALYAAYARWCEDNTLKPMSGTSFGVEIKKRFTAKHTKAGNVYIGVGLRSEYPAEAEDLDALLLLKEEGQHKTVDQVEGQPALADQGQLQPASLEEARARKLLEKFRVAASKGYSIKLRDDTGGIEYRLSDALSPNERAGIIAEINALNEQLILQLEAERDLADASPDPDFIVKGNKYILKD